MLYLLSTSINEFHKKGNIFVDMSLTYVDCSFCPSNLICSDTCSRWRDLRRRPRWDKANPRSRRYLQRIKTFTTFRSNANIWQQQPCNVLDVFQHYILLDVIYQWVHELPHASTVCTYTCQHTLDFFLAHKNTNAPYLGQVTNLLISQLTPEYPGGQKQV